MLMGGKLDSRIDAVEMVPIDDPQYAGYLQCLGRIDAANPRVGIRAQKRRAIRSARKIGRSSMYWAWPVTLALRSMRGAAAVLLPLSWTGDFGLHYVLPLEP